MSVTYNPDGSGTITVNGVIRAFPAGITANAPNVTELEANVADLQANVTALQTSVAALTKPPVT